MKYVWGALGVVLLGWFFWSSARNTNETGVGQVVVSPTISIKQLNGYAYKLVEVADGNEVALLGNWNKKLSVEDIALTNGCKAASNGNFYDLEGMPLGLFINEQWRNLAVSPSKTLNGFASFSDGILTIDSLPPEEDVKWAFQSGPLLMTNGKKIALQTVNDENARRTVLAKSGSKFYLMTIFSENSPLNGPLLSELPTLIGDLSESNNMGIISAINLDGGTASAFYGDGEYLDELVFCASVICVK